jgi:hypothetical protein
MKSTGEQDPQHSPPKEEKPSTKPTAWDAHKRAFFIALVLSLLVTMV